MFYISNSALFYFAIFIETPSGAFVLSSSPATILFSALAAISSTRSTILFTWATALILVIFIAFCSKASVGSSGMSAFSTENHYCWILSKLILPSGMSVSYGREAAASISVNGISFGSFEYKTLFKL